MTKTSRYNRMVWSNSGGEWSDSQSGSGSRSWCSTKSGTDSWSRSESGSDGWSGSWSGSVGRFSSDHSWSCSGDDLPKPGCIITVYSDEDL